MLLYRYTYLLLRYLLFLPRKHFYPPIYYLLQPRLIASAAAVAHTQQHLFPLGPPSRLHHWRKKRTHSCVGRNQLAVKSACVAMGRASNTPTRNDWHAGNMFWRLLSPLYGGIEIHTWWCGHQEERVFRLINVIYWEVYSSCCVW